MLSLKEKLSLQKTVKNGLDSLKAGIADLRARLATQREIKNALERLKGGTPAPGTLFEQLLAGKFLGEAPVKFLSILKKVLAEINDNVQLVQEPVIAYIKAHHTEEGVFESAGGTENAASALAFLTEHTPPKTPGAVRSTPKGFEYGAPQDIVIDIDTEFDSPETFRGIIRAIEQARENDTIILKVNSHGGRTDSAQAVYVALLETRAKTIARIITAYSSGSIVTMACDEIQTTPHCTMMIHNASAGTWGKIGDMKAQTSFLEDHFKKWFGELYAGFLTPEEISDVFKGQDIWLREEEIKQRLPNWKPIRARRAAELQAAAE